MDFNHTHFPSFFTPPLLGENVASSINANNIEREQDVQVGKQAAFSGEKGHKFTTFI